MWVRLNTEVTQIQYGPAEQQLSISAGTYKTVEKSSAVIVTVSTGVINARRLTFTGSGSHAVIAAYAKLPMGNYKKVVLVFDREVALGAAPEARGTDATHRGTSVYWYLDDDERLWKFLVPDINRKIVITIVGGALATALDASDQVALQRTSAALIAAGVITDAATVLEKYFSKWMTEPTFQGAYSYTAVGGAGGRAALIAQPLLNSGVAFAGEALFKKYGTAHGAYITGLRAGKAVVGTLPRLGFDTAANMTGV